MNNEQNLVKRVCEELNINQRELAEELDIAQSTLSEWATKGISKLGENYIKLWIENKELKKVRIYQAGKRNYQRPLIRLLNIISYRNL